jgi:hypothetical protein
LLTFCCCGLKDIINLDPVIRNLSVLPHVRRGLRLSVSAPMLIIESITGSTKKCGATNSRRNDNRLAPIPLREAGLVG